MISERTVYKISDSWVSSYKNSTKIFPRLNGTVSFTAACVNVYKFSKCFTLNGTNIFSQALPVYSVCSGWSWHLHWSKQWDLDKTLISLLQTCGLESGFRPVMCLDWDLDSSPLSSQTQLSLHLAVTPIAVHCLLSLYPIWPQNKIIRLPVVLIIHVQMYYH